MAKKQTTPTAPSAPPPPARPAGSYQGLARKWRPQTFADLIGQEEVAQSLMNSVRGNRVVHGHILSGPRGVGKTTSARILARALNCEQGPTPTPCGKCRHCIDIAQGNDMDVVEMDAASNTGIDDMRELLERVALVPFSARFKVYIIDEVHMLSKSAFNALLKTLEEPPPNVIFIFATTEFEKIPETVQSRCSRHAFRRLSSEDIVRRLIHVAHGEGIKLEEETERQVYALIAQAAEGGMRDALVSLDQILAMTGGKPDVESAERLLGLASHSTMGDTIQWLAEGNAAKLLELIEDLVSRGRSLERFIKGLIGYAHDIMLLQAGTQGSLISLTGDGLERAKELAGKFSQAGVFNLMNQLFELEERMKRSQQARFLIEFAFLRMAAIKPVLPIEDLIAKLRALPGEGNAASIAKAQPVAAKEERAPTQFGAGATRATLSEEGKADLRKAQTYSAAPAFYDSETEERGEGPSSLAEAPAAYAPEAERARPGASPGAHSLMGLAREELIEMIGPQLPEAQQFLGRYLKVATAMRADEKSLRIQWPKDATTASRMLAKPENKAALERTLALISGRGMTVQWDFTGEASPGAAEPVRARGTEPAAAFADSEPPIEYRDEDFSDGSAGYASNSAALPPREAEAVKPGKIEAADPLAGITTEGTRGILAANGDLARRAKMVRDMFSGSFVDASGQLIQT